ncbi:MAG: hypothetical protein AB7W16_05340 [Candidatus Obscuribacterales bacterium]
MAGQGQEAEVKKDPGKGQENVQQGAERHEDAALKQRDNASLNGANEAFDHMKANSGDKNGQDTAAVNLAANDVAVQNGFPSAENLLTTGDVTTDKKGDGPEAGGDQPGMVEDGSRTVFGRMGDWAAGAVSTLKDSATSALDSMSEGWDDFYDAAGDWLGIGGDPEQDIKSASDLAAVSKGAGQDLLDANKDKVQQLHGKEGKEFVEGKIGDMDIPSGASDRGKFGQVMDALGNGLKGDHVVTKTGPNGDKIQTDPDTGFERIESADGRSVVLRMSDGSVVTRQSDESGEISSEQWRFKNDDGTYSVLNHEGRGRWSGVVDGVTVASDNGAHVEQDTANNFDITKHGLSEGVGETEDKWFTSDGDGHVMTIDKQSGQAELYVNGQRYHFDNTGTLVGEDGKPAGDLGLQTDSQSGDTTIGGLTIGRDHRHGWAHGHHGGKHRISADANDDGSHIVSEGVAPDAYTGPDAEPPGEKYARDADRNNAAHTLHDIRGNEGQPGIANSDGYTISQDPETGNIIWKDSNGNKVADFNIHDGKGQTDGFHFDGDDVTMDKNGLTINGLGDILDATGEAIFTSSDNLWYGSGWGTDSYNYNYTTGMSPEQAQSTVQGEVNEARTVAMPAFLAAMSCGQTGGDMTNMKGMISAGIGQIDQAKSLCLALGAVDQIGVLDSMLATGLAANSQSDRQATLDSTMGLYMEGGGVGQGMMLNGLRAKLATGGTFTISVVDEMKNWDRTHGNAEMIV